ncbi:MAG: class I SAM-dependent methyltransferase [Polyangia bacterium]
MSAQPDQVAHTPSLVAGSEASARAGAAAPGLALAEVLPGSRVGRSAVSIFDAMQQAAAAQGWFAAAALLSQRLRAARELRSPERRFVSDALHDLVRGLRRLRHLAVLAGNQAAAKRPGALALYLALLCDQHAQAAGEGAEVRLPKALLSAAGAAGIDTRGLLERLAGLRRDEPRLVDLLSGPAGDHANSQAGSQAAGQAPEGLSRIAEVLSYPDWIARLLIDDLGAEAGVAVLRAQNHRAPLTVRANLLRCTRDELAERLLREGIESTPTALAPHGLQLHTRTNAYGLAAFQEGWFELQDEGSQLIAELVQPPPGSLVVDACAGAGGKTLAIGALLHNRGRLVAIDVDRDKLDELKRRARRAGLTNVQVLCTSMAEGSDADRGAGEAAGRRVPFQPLPADLYSRGAARVLVDAPCSGLGVLRRNPEARWRLRREDLDEIGAKQRAILCGAARLVQPGGRLIYATCTILQRENDDVVAALLRERPDFSIVPISEVLPGLRTERQPERDGPAGPAPSDDRFLRTLPAEAHGPDGFFAAVLERRA